jgi:hypothetical protein
VLQDRLSIIALLPSNNFSSGYIIQYIIYFMRLLCSLCHFDPTKNIIPPHSNSNSKSTTSIIYNMRLYHDYYGSYLSKCVYIKKSYIMFTIVFDEETHCSSGSHRDKGCRRRRHRIPCCIRLLFQSLEEWFSDRKL